MMHKIILIFFLIVKAINFWTQNSWIVPLTFISIWIMLQSIDFNFYVNYATSID
jgi:hypothetical protein